ncbi:MAG: hypothetical protein MK169_00540, partial [Candidatus Thalassarchaeum sp.]|nr:hypothetical protein [Candidatus Thalassarchaeum sp.]
WISSSSIRSLTETSQTPRLNILRRIPEGGVGQVTVEVGGGQKTYNAKSEDGQGIATGDFIEVVDIISSTLIVKRV